MTRRDLVREIMALGYSRRHATRLLAAVLDAMVLSLQHHQSVELPFGRLVVKSAPDKRRQYRFGHIVDHWVEPYRVVLENTKSAVGEDKTHGARWQRWKV